MVAGQTLPRSAEAYFRAQAVEGDAAIRATRRQWSRLSPTAVLESYEQARPTLLAVALTAQARFVRPVGEFFSSVLRETGQRDDALASPLAGSLVGWAGDGRTVEGLLDVAPRITLARIGEGLPGPAALKEGQDFLDMAVTTTLWDTARHAESLEIAVRPGIDGYVRMLNPGIHGACSRCAVQAGRWFRRNTGFERHPRCFPEGVVVNGPSFEGATRRWFEGELVVLTTESGQRLPLTGNHPVLTRRGWVPAHFLQEGDEIVRSARPEGATPLVVPDHHEVPSRVEDVWGALSVTGLDAVESSPEDFHGDGRHGQVDVVGANGSLDHWGDAALHEHLAQLDLALTAGPALLLYRERPSVLLDAGHTSHPGGLVGGGSLLASLLGRHSGSAGTVGLGHVAEFNTSLTEALFDDVARYAVLLGERVAAGAGQVGLGDLVDRQVNPLARWDAPAEAYSVESRVRYAAVGKDLLERLSGQVELDRLVLCERVDFRGHVYSVQSSEGWHSANNYIVSNCRCVHVPASEANMNDYRLNPDDYFASLSEADQNRIFTNAGAEAIRAGADPTKVVNARRGMNTAQTNPRGWKPQGRLEPVDRYGRQVYVTTEGTTRRGAASRALTGRRGERLMPESILQIADDQDDLMRLLKLNGYLP